VQQVLTLKRQFGAVVAQLLGANLKVERVEEGAGSKTI
jgi:hypothetical protein